MVRAEDVTTICQRLAAQDIPVWLIGGWGVDALLGEQTRPHKDLDLLVRLDDVVRLTTILSQDGFTLKELWSENRQAVDPNGVETPTAFVLWGSQGREVDVHALHLDEQGNGIPDWEAGSFIFPRQSLAAKGQIAGKTVRCLSPEMQMVCHTGYDLPISHRRDLALLHEKLGVDYPAGISP